VVTSGGDQVFPRGLSVGTIEKIEADPNHQPYTIITLKAAANLFQLDEVLVITGLGAGLPGGVQQELVTDGAMHAADVSAERLPSVHDGDPAPADPNATGADAMPPPDNSRDLVPKPKPAVHPDRYSMGATPPAEDLTPGGGKNTAVLPVEPPKAKAPKAEVPPPPA